MNGFTGNDPDAMERLAERARHTAAAVLATRVIVQGVQRDAPVYGDLATRMIAEFESQLLPRLRQAEDALALVNDVLVWNAADQRRVSDGGERRSGPPPEYRTPQLAGSRNFISPPLIHQQQTYQYKKPTPPTFADGVSFDERISNTQDQLARLIDETQRRMDEQVQRRPDVQRQLDEFLRQRTQQMSRPLSIDSPLGLAISEASRELALIDELKAEIEADIKLYQSLLGRQILYFDPTGDGALVELHGKIDENTKNLAIMVPGMNVDKISVANTTQRANEFVAKSDGQLAIVVALLGDHPDGVEAVSASYAQELGRPLKELGDALWAEADQRGASSVKMTVEPHSYAAVIVGEAEKLGLWTDRILYMAGAGAGNDVHSLDELRNVNPNIQRYAITAPWDPVGLVPLMPNVGNWGLGSVDFTDAPGVTRLCTGTYPRPDGTEEVSRGLLAHVGIWKKDSDSWDNAFGVMNSGNVREVVQRPLDGGWTGLPVPIMTRSDFCGPAIDIDDLELRNQRKGGK